MAVTVPFDLAYEFEVNAPAAEVFAVLADVPTSASHFPKVARLVDLGAGSYRWEMEKLGAAGLSFQTIYASRYKADKKKRSVVWLPVAGQGNAQVGGSWQITDKKKYSHLLLKINGTLSLPLPGLMQALVAPVVLAENEALVEQYIANLCKRFGGEHG